MLIQRSPLTRQGQRTTTDATANPMLRAALRYAREGIAVFPCVPGNKNPLTKHGFRDATTDRDAITWWWSRHPDANLAIPTGAPNFDVLDTDVRRTGSGLPTLDAMRRLGLLAGMRGRVTTPSGGSHLYFNGSNQAKSKLPYGRFTDFQAKGAYVLVPPSYVETAEYRGVYRWTVPLRDNGGQLDWARVQAIFDVHQGMTSTKSTQRFVTPGSSHLARWLAGAQEGARNDRLLWASCEAWREGHTDWSDIVSAALCTGMEEAEIKTTIASARRQVRGAS